MSRYIVVIFLVSVFSCSIYSCGICSKKIDCPGYKSDILDAWFPYQDNQLLVFLSNVNERDSFTLKNTNTTAPYQVTSSWEGGAECREGEKTFQSKEIDTAGKSLMSVHYTGTENRIVFTIRQTYFGLRNVGENGLMEQNVYNEKIKQTLLPSLVIGNVTFSNVIETTFDTTNMRNNGVYKMYHAKNQGLIGYSEYPSLKTWVKQ